MTGVIAGLDRSDPTKPRARELAVDSQGRLVVVMSGEGAAGAGAPVDGSGTIAVGGTAQVLFGGTVPDAGYAIYNADPDNDLWINDRRASRQLSPESCSPLLFSLHGDDRFSLGIESHHGNR